MRVIYRDRCRTPKDGCDGSAVSGLAARRKSEKDEPSHPSALIGQTASLAGSAMGLQCWQPSTASSEWHAGKWRRTKRGGHSRIGLSHL